MTIEITEALAQKVLAIVDAGLTDGLGSPVPGAMCVEAAVNYAMGLPHDDKPPCVAPTLRAFKIRLNDCTYWSGPEWRAKGLRRLAVAQLGSAGVLDEQEFTKRLRHMLVSKILPSTLEGAAKLHTNQVHKTALRGAADLCRTCSPRVADMAFAATEAKWVVTDALLAVDSPTFRLTDILHDVADMATTVSCACTEAEYKTACTLCAASASINARFLSRLVPQTKVYEFLSSVAEDVVQILVEMGAPGCQWLPLTE